MRAIYGRSAAWFCRTILNSFPLEMQHAIVNTIGFLCEVYGYSTSVHLRHMYLRWNLGEQLVNY